MWHKSSAKPIPRPQPWAGIHPRTLPEARGPPGKGDAEEPVGWLQMLGKQLLRLALQVSSLCPWSTGGGEAVKEGV